MSLASSHAPRADAPWFVDGLGERHVVADPGTGELLEVLRLHPAIAAVPPFEVALRERTARLTNVAHGAFARVRAVDRLHGAALVLVSEHVEGTRLSEILRVAHTRGVLPGTSAAVYLIRQLIAAMAGLHEHARDVSHGLVSPERLIATPQGRLVVTEHVAGSAVEGLQYGREQLWGAFRSAVPASAGLPRLDQRADVNGIGLTALSLLLGRPLAMGEFPHGIPALVTQVRARVGQGDERALPASLLNWLTCALQLDIRRAFSSASESMRALDVVLAAEPGLVDTPVGLEAFLAQPAETTPYAVRESAPPGERRSPPLEAAPPATHRENSRPLNHERAAGAPGGPPAPRTGARTGAGALAPKAAPPERTGAHLAIRGIWRRVATNRLVVVALLLALAGGGLLASRTSTRDDLSGTIVVHSSPAGVDVFLDGIHRGVTPARLPVSAGAHILELRGRGVPRVIPLQVPAGGQVSQYLEFADTPRTGMLVVHSQPAGAAVIVDGIARGTAPLTIEGLEPGNREVVLRNDKGRSRHVVRVLAGTTASLVAPVVPAGPEGPVSGWIKVTAPFTIEIHQDGRLVGSTDTDRLMLPAGRQALEFVNEPLGYRERQVVHVLPGRLTPVTLALPTGRVDLNASPWAEVSIDGRPVGETPIGNLELPIGPHEIVFRHPQLGERRHAVSVTTAAPVRVSVTMTN